MTIEDQPFFFHAKHYRATNPDLEQLSDEELLRHFYERGIDEGRAGHRYSFRDKLIALAQQHDNVWLDAHGQGLSNLRRLIDGVGAERVFFGSDWPWYPIAASLAKILIVTEGDQTVRDLILAENARTFFG